MTKLRLAKFALVMGLLACQQFAVAADEVLTRAKKLVDERKAAQAYALLAPLQSQRAGEPEYDYLLALAALDSGKPAEAVFALERFLAANPNHGPARLELARAYYMMGETRSSRAEFEAVKKQAPPDQVADAIRQYVSAIDQITTADGTRVRGYLEASVGHDSNVNSATSATTIAIPIFGGAIATLDPASVRRSDTFVSAAGGVSLRHPLSAALAVNANASYSHRKHNNFGQYDLGSFDGSAGLSYTEGIHQYTGALQYQRIYLDGSSYRQTWGLLGQWQYSVDDLSQFTAYGQYMRMSYNTAQQIRDGDRYVAGVAYSHAFPSVSFTPIAYVGAYVGRERPHASTVPHLGNNFYGLRVGGQLVLGPQLSLVGNASHEDRGYRGAEPGFLRDRSDRQTDLGLALVYTPAPEWTVRPEITHTRNHSNIGFNDFSRTQYFVTVRRDFN